MHHSGFTKCRFLAILFALYSFHLMLHRVYKDTTSNITNTQTKHLGCKEHQKYPRLATFNGVFEVYKLVAV